MFQCSITFAGACQWGAWEMCMHVYRSTFLCVIASVGLAARFMMALVGVDNSIRGETDLVVE